MQIYNLLFFGGLCRTISWLRAETRARLAVSAYFQTLYQAKLTGSSYIFNGQIWALDRSSHLALHQKEDKYISQTVEDIDMWSRQIFVVFQRTTYVWQQPLQCYGGESLPAQKVSACVSLDFWLRFGVSTGTIAAALLIGISCYFWKKTRKWDDWAFHFFVFLSKHWYVIQVNNIKLKPQLRV